MRSPSDAQALSFTFSDREVILGVLIYVLAAGSDVNGKLLATLDAWESIGPLPTGL